MISRSRIASLLAFLLFLSVSALAQSNLIEHTVQKGETLYRLSLKYGVTVEQIMQANPGLTAETLNAGSVVRIPANGIANSGCREMHRVKKGETLWGIARQYGVTVEELVAANAEASSADFKLKKGKFICIPYPSSAQIAREKPDTIAVPPVAKKATKVTVAVLLPLTSGKPEGIRSVEYYRGFLMAVEKIKGQGKDVEVLAFDEKSAEMSLTGAFAKMKQHGVQLIIGPVYNTHFPVVSQFAAKENMRVFVPFSSKVSEVETHPQLFLMNAPDANKYSYAADLFLKTFPSAKTLILETSRKNESAFTGLLASRLRAKGRSVASIGADFTPRQLKELLSGSGLTVFVPDASDRNTLAQLLSKLKAFRAEYPGFQTALFGYPDWQTYKDKYAEDFYKENTYLFTNFFYNEYSPATRYLEAEYRRWFKTGMLDTYPRMALLGYDAGLYMMTGILEHGLNFNVQPLTLPLLQCSFSFERTGEGNGGYVNKCMMFIHYKKDGSIEKVCPN